MAQPWSTSPRTRSSGTRTSSKKTSQNFSGAVHRLDRPHRDPGTVHVDEQRGDPLVGRFGRPRAREEHAPLRVLGQARPDLLAADPPPLVGPRGPAGEGGQVAPRPRLGEPLAPDLVTAQQARHHVGREVLRCVVDHGRRQHLGHRVDARLDEVTRGERLAEIRTQQIRASESADALGPAHAHEAGVVRQPHDLAQLRHLLIEGSDSRVRRGELGLVLVEPGVDRRLEVPELHRARLVGGACGGRRPVRVVRPAGVARPAAP